MPEAYAADVDRGRREFLRNIAITGGTALFVAGAGLGIGVAVAERLVPDEAEPAEIAAGFNGDWTEVSVFAGGVILGSAVDLYQTADLDPGRKMSWVDDADHLAVRRPFMVSESAALNDSSTRGLSPNAMGFWLPKSDTLAFMEYDHTAPIYPIARGASPSYDTDLQQVFGEAVTLSADRQGPRHPRQFFVTSVREGAGGPVVTVRIKDVAQSVGIAADKIPNFIGLQSRTFGGFELKNHSFDSDQPIIDTNVTNPELTLESAVEINEGLQYRWNKVNVFPGAVGVTRTAKLYADPDLSESTEMKWPKGLSHVVAVRPMFPAASAIQNLKGRELERILERVKPTTIGFWLPGPGKFVYLDTEESLGSILPVNRGDQIYPDPIKRNGLAGYDITIDGRTPGSGEDGDTVYPFVNDISSMSVPADKRLLGPKGLDDFASDFTPGVIKTLNRNVVGHSAACATGVDVVATVNRFDEDPGLELTHIP